MPHLALDIGGTHTRYQLGDGEKGKVPTDLETLIPFITSLVKSYGLPEAIGISIAGQTNQGHLIGAPNIPMGPFEDKNLAQALSEHFNIPVAIDNDLKCAVIAEATVHPGDSLAAIYVGTGLGSALIDGKRLIRGHRNLAGEVGHLPYRPAPFTCGCGGNDCVELYASGSGITRWCQHEGLRAQTLGELEVLSHAGNQKAKVILQQFQDALFFALKSVQTLLNPEIIVLGGGVIANNSWLVTKMQEGINKRGFKPAGATTIKTTTFGDDAPLIGAMELARQLTPKG